MGDHSYMSSHWDHSLIGNYAFFITKRTRLSQRGWYMPSMYFSFRDVFSFRSSCFMFHCMTVCELWFWFCCLFWLVLLHLVWTEWTELCRRHSNDYRTTNFDQKWVCVQISPFMNIACTEALRDASCDIGTVLSMTLLARECCFRPSQLQGVKKLRSKFIRSGGQKMITSWFACV